MPTNYSKDSNNSRLVEPIYICSMPRSLLYITLFLLSSCNLTQRTSCACYVNQVTDRSSTSPMMMNDLDSAKACAKSCDRPLIIYFSGWACVNSRKMESNVFGAPDLKKYMEKNFVMVSLFVDDATPLDSVYYSDFLEDSVKTIGDQNYLFEKQIYGKESQPYFVIVDHQDSILHAFPYEPEVQYVKEYLSHSLSAFKKSKN